jgi:hypothetical protein
MSEFRSPMPADPSQALRALVGKISPSAACEFYQELMGMEIVSMEVEEIAERVREEILQLLADADSVL